MEKEETNIENNEQPVPELSPEERLKPKISPVVAAFMGMFIVLILYQGIGGIISLFLFGLNMQNIDPTMLRLYTIAGQMLFILLPSIVLSKAIYEDVTTIIRFRMPAFKEAALFLMGLVILIPLLQNLTFIQSYFFQKLAENNGVLQQLKEFFDSADKMVESTYVSFFSVKSIFDVLLISITVAVTPAICEEFFFRGFVQKSFELKMKPLWSILITAFVFSLNHFSPYGLIPIFILGIFLGYSAYKSNSIFIPISLHFVNNFLMIILYFMVGVEGVEAKPGPEVQISSFLVLLLLNSIVFVAWIFFARNFYRKTGTN